MSTYVVLTCADGKLPEEVARPRPIHYVCYALTAFLRTARLASFVGVDIWSHFAMTEVCITHYAIMVGHSLRPLTIVAYVVYDNPLTFV